MLFLHTMHLSSRCSNFFSHLLLSPSFFFFSFIHHDFASISRGEVNSTLLVFWPSRFAYRSRCKTAAQSVTGIYFRMNFRAFDERQFRWAPCTRATIRDTTLKRENWRIQGRTQSLLSARPRETRLLCLGLVRGGKTLRNARLDWKIVGK